MAESTEALKNMHFQGPVQMHPTFHPTFSSHVG